MKKLLIALLCSFTIHAQTFEFDCRDNYTLPIDYSHITLNTHVFEYIELFADDLRETTGRNFDTGLNRLSIVRDTYSVYGNPSVQVALVDGLSDIGSTDKICIDDVVYIIIRRSFWENASIVQRLWIVYHELGHDILNLLHVSNPNNGYKDIMQQGNSAVQGLPLAFFIEQKNRMFNDIGQVHADCELN